jgi:hypothetical protein
MMPHPPFVVDNKPWPRRLEPRESVTVYFLGNYKFPRNLGRAYATTDCDVQRFGDSPALQKFHSLLQQASE